MKSYPTLCGSISGSIGGLGVIMHNAAYKYMNLPYTYVSFQPKELEGAIKSMRVLGIKGLGVTMPYKKDVIPYLDEVDASIQQIGAVNTILNKKDRLIGYNTDWRGIEKSLLNVTELKDRKVVILGAGGVARAAIYALKRHTNDISLYNRHEGRGQSLVREYGITYKGQPEQFGHDDIEDYDILINASSVGFKSEESILKVGQMQSGKVVMDVVFTPVETTFIKQARTLDCQVIEGYNISLYQACYQFELYTGEKAPIEVMRDALVKSLQV